MCEAGRGMDMRVATARRGRAGTREEPAAAPSAGSKARGDAPAAAGPVELTVWNTGCPGAADAPPSVGTRSTVSHGLSEPAVAVEDELEVIPVSPIRATSSASPAAAAARSSAAATEPLRLTAPGVCDTAAVGAGITFRLEVRSRASTAAMKLEFCRSASRACHMHQANSEWVTLIRSLEYAS